MRLSAHALSPLQQLRFCCNVRLCRAGLIYRMKDPKVVLLIFVSGKVVLTGQCNQSPLSHLTSLSLGHHWVAGSPLLAPCCTYTSCAACGLGLDAL